MDAQNTVLVDFIAAEPTTMSPDSYATEALHLMWDGGFRHILVVYNDCVVGVVSQGVFKASENDRLDEERKFWEHMG